MATEERYLTTAELAEKTGKSTDYWQRVCKSGAIAAAKLGNDWRVAESVFQQFMRGGGTALVARPDRKSARQKRRAG